MKNVMNIKSLAVTIAAALLMSFNVAAAVPDSQQQAVTDVGATQEKAKKLGGGFVVGMSPEQTCLFFKKYYRIRNENNELCRLVGRRDFTNMTVVNKQITNGIHRVQQVENIAFFFDEYEELRLVMAVEDASHVGGLKREFVRQNEYAQRNRVNDDF